MENNRTLHLCLRRTCRSVLPQRSASQSSAVVANTLLVITAQHLWILLFFVFSKKDLAARCQLWKFRTRVPNAVSHASNHADYLDIPRQQLLPVGMRTCQMSNPQKRKDPNREREQPRNENPKGSEAEGMTRTRAIINLSPALFCLPPPTAMALMPVIAPIITDQIMTIKWLCPSDY